MLDSRFVPEGWRPPFKRDIGCTYDGRILCVQRVAAFLATLDPTIEFSPLPSKPSVLLLRVTRTLPFDPSVRPVRFIGKCQSCGSYTEVIGSLPAAFQQSALLDLEEGLYRSDLEFGSREGKGPLLVATASLVSGLLARRFSGLTLVPL